MLLVLVVMTGQLLFGHRGAGLAGRRPVPLGRWLAVGLFVIVKPVGNDGKQRLEASLCIGFGGCE
jgi:hypothetical protein